MKLSRRGFLGALLAAAGVRAAPPAEEPMITLIEKRMQDAYLKMSETLAREIYLNGAA